MGREVRYRVEYTVPVAGGPGREFAHVYLPPKGPGLPDTDVAREIISAGWAKVHDSGSRRNANSQPEEEEEGGWKAKLRELQEEAKAAARGVWGPDELFKVDHTMPDDTQSFLAEYKGKPLESVVEQVRDGSMLRVRLFLSPRHHQLVNLSLAGVKSPRVAGAGGPGSNDRSEEFGEEAKFFVESRLLQRNIKVTLLSMPQPTAAPTPFSATASAAPPPPPTTGECSNEVAPLKSSRAILCRANGADYILLDRSGRSHRNRSPSRRRHRPILVGCGLGALRGLACRHVGVYWRHGKVPCCGEVSSIRGCNRTLFTETDAVSTMALQGCQGQALESLELIRSHKLKQHYVRSGCSAHV